MALIVSQAGSQAETRRLQRAAAAGELRRIHAGVYTDDLKSPLEAVTRRELYPLLAAVAPDAVISHRSALESGPTKANELFLTGEYRREIELPGLLLRIVKGGRARAQDIHIPTPLGEIHRSSDARALLENLQVARAPDPERRRALGQAAVEQWLERLLAREGEVALNRVRDQARDAAKDLDLTAEFNRLDSLIGALLGTRRAKLTHPQAIARMQGAPYDAQRVDLFQVVAKHLHDHAPRVAPAQTEIDQNLQAFVESYFSNYIEGTEFELEEAHHIVVEGRPLQYREDDSHDIIGTFNSILESVARPVFPTDFAAFLLQLKAWNRQVIFARAERKPGEIKDEPNRAGNTLFVAPELVIGTLMKGLELIVAAASPAARAALAMFVVAEVHPFRDGNGRTARLAMNLAFSEAGLTRIIIPTVFREDHLLSLKALSRNSKPEPYGRMLERASEFSSWLDYRSQPTCFEQLKESNALARPEEAKLNFGHAKAVAAQ